MAFLLIFRPAKNRQVNHLALDRPEMTVVFFHIPGLPLILTVS